VLTEESSMNVMAAEHKWKFGLILSTVINGNFDPKKLTY